MPDLSRLKRPVASFLCFVLALGAMLAVTPGDTPVARAAQVTLTSFMVTGTYSEPGGQPTADGQFHNGNVGSYPEKACVVALVEARNDGSDPEDILVTIEYDYQHQGNHPEVGIEDIEAVSFNGEGNPADSADNLDDFTFSGGSIAGVASFPTASGGTVTATVSGPVDVNNQGTIKSYDITLEDVPAGETAYVLFCGRLGEDAGAFPGASMSIASGQGGNENIAIPTEDLIELPSLTLTKVVDSGDALPNEWSFEVSPAIEGETVFNIADGEDTVVIRNIPVDGEYTVTEIGPEGYAFASGDGANCSFDGIGGATATLVADTTPQDAECVFTNEALPLPTVTIVKEVVNDDGGTAAIDAFELYIDQTAVTSGQIVEVEPGTYVASEANLEGYEGSFSGDCDADGNITVDYGENAVCTITNDDIAPEPEMAELTIVKTVINDDNGAAVAADFTLEVTGVNPSENSVTGDEAGVTITLEPGEYGVTESDPGSYSVSYSEDCSGAIAAGESLTCTVTNDDPASTGGGGGGEPTTDTGTITVTKVVVNDNGGTAEVSDFTLKVSGTHVDSGEPNEFAVGSYVISEIMPDGSTSYVGTFSGDCDAQGNLTLEADQERECVITNDDVADTAYPTSENDPPSLRVVVLVVNDSGRDLRPSDVPVTVSGVNVSPASFDGSSSGILVSLDPGDFSVSSETSRYYSRRMSDDCEGTIANGQALTCTITYDDRLRGGGRGGSSVPPSTGSTAPSSNGGQGQVLAYVEEAPPLVDPVVVTDPIPDPVPTLDPEPVPEPAVLAYVESAPVLPRTGMPAWLLLALLLLPAIRMGRLAT